MVMVTAGINLAKQVFALCQQVFALYVAGLLIHAGAPRRNEREVTSLHSQPARSALLMMYLTPHRWNGTMKKR